MRDSLTKLKAFEKRAGSEHYGSALILGVFSLFLLTSLYSATMWFVLAITTCTSCSSKPHLRSQSCRGGHASEYITLIRGSTWCRISLQLVGPQNQSHLTALDTYVWEKASSPLRGYSRSTQESLNKAFARNFPDQVHRWSGELSCSSSCLNVHGSVVFPFLKLALNCHFRMWLARWSDIYLCFTEACQIYALSPCISQV